MELIHGNAKLSALQKSSEVPHTTKLGKFVCQAVTALVQHIFAVLITTCHNQEKQIHALTHNHNWCITPS
jgi:hypothetical protein